MLVPVLFGVSLAVFGLIQLFSVNQRAALYVTNPSQLSDLSGIIERYGLGDPLWTQYGTWISQVAHGNLGWSQLFGMPVHEALLQFLPATLEIALVATPLIIMLGVFLGSKAAANKDRTVDHATRLGAIVGWSLPAFWLGLVLLLIFYGYLGLLPPERLGTEMSLVVGSEGFRQYTHLHTVDAVLNGNFRVLADALRHLILPVVTVTVINVAFVMRLMRSSMLESLGKGYVLTARAKGLDESTVSRHARRNAIIPVVTVSGYVFASIITGVVITETIFDIEGLGWMAWQAAVNLDVPTILGFTMFAAVLFVVVNLAVDLIYARIDPRVRLGGQMK